MSHPPYDGQAPRPPVNGKAQAALWSGVGLLVTACCGVGLLGFVPVVLGVAARAEIAASGGRQGGDGMALAGIITGGIALVVSLVVVAVVVVALVAYQSGPIENGVTGV